MERNLKRTDLARKISEYQSTHDETIATELMKSLEPLVMSVCRKFYMDGMEQDDVLQEGRVGLYKAMRDYRPGYGTTFVSFAVRCIRCQCITAVKAANRYKQQILSQALSLDVTMHEDNERRCWLDMLVDEDVPAPGEEMMIEESIEQCDTILRNLLSPYHFRVLVARLEGGSYTSIAHEFGRNPKSVDNALQRAKKLIFGYLEEHDDLDAWMLEHYFAHIADRKSDDDDASAIA